MQINTGNLNNLFTGFSTAFNKGFDGAATAYKLISMTVPSSTGEETYGWIGQIPKLREWIGDRQVRSLVTHGYAIKNRDFEDTITVDRNAIQDDQYGIYASLFSELGRVAAEMPDELVFGLLRSGFETKCYDDKPFFSETHIVEAASGEPKSVSNMQAGDGPAWYLLDCSRAMRPLIFQERQPFNRLDKLDDPHAPNVFFKKQYIYGVEGRANAGYGLWQLAFGSKAPLNATNYAAARKAMMTLRGDGDRNLGIRPDIMVVGPDFEEAGLKLLNSELIDGGQSNPWKNTAKLIVTPWADE